MTSYTKKIFAFLLILLTSFSVLACDLFTTSSTTSATTETTSSTTTEYITSGTWWQHDVDIELSGTYKNVYELGESLDLTGLIVSAINGLGDKTVLSSEVYTVSGYDNQTPGMQTITVTYATFTKTFVVYVKETPINFSFTLSVTPPTKLEYSVNETLDLTGMVVKLVGEDTSYITLTNSQYSLNDVDMSTVGEVEVIISVLGLESSFTITISEDTLVLTEYYQSAEGLTGTQLVSQLRIIVHTGFVGVTYGDARYMLDDTDRDPNNANNLILVYLGTSVSGAWDGGITWNREHVWPQSLLGVPADNGTVNAAIDLHNLKPANPSTNSSRGNKFYDDMTTSVSYAPTRLEVRGDLARILFYMVIMYQIYSLVNTTPTTNQMGKLDTLLEWHDLDPVDDFERNRNDKIYSFQHNRNPFIDYPQFVDMIWS